MEANSLLLSKNSIDIFFGGDTAYTEIFKQQLEATPIHLAIIGIGCYSPKSFETRHANPEQSWQNLQGDRCPVGYSHALKGLPSLQM